MTDALLSDSQGVFGGVFLPAEYGIDVGNSGTDALSPSKVRQNVVVGSCIDLLRDQEVAGSNPIAPT